MFNVKSVIAASVIGIGSMLGSVGSVQAFWVSGTNGRYWTFSQVVGSEYGSRINCRPKPYFSSNDGSYVLVGQVVRVIGWFHPIHNQDKEATQFTQIEIKWI